MITKDSYFYKDHILSNIDIKSSPDGRFQDCWYWTKSLRGGYGQIRYLNKQVYVHRLSAFIFGVNKDINGNIIDDLIFDLNSKLLVCHHCDNKRCFNPNHLFIGTDLDNINDKIKKNRQVKGLDINTCKLTEQNIIEIRDLYENRIFNQYELAEIYGVSQAHISSIIHKTKWKHVK